MLDWSQVTSWVVTDGKAGMENQSLGLIEAMGLNPTIKRIRLRTPWRQLTPLLRVGLSHAFHEDSGLRPPWPDLIVATGRMSIAASLYIGKMSKHTFRVQLQNPQISPSAFDLVVVPAHDNLNGVNVMTTRGSMHRMRPEILEKESAKLRSLIAPLPKPHIAVLIGGNSAVYKLTSHELMPIIGQLKALVQQTGGSLLVTPSRRTGEENIALLQKELSDVPAYLWDGTGWNPYYGMLALADAFLATADSVNMISEACTTGKPVHVIELAGGSEKFRRFHKLFEDEGLTRPFRGKLEQWSYTPLNDPQLVAARVKEMMEKRANMQR